MPQSESAIESKNYWKWQITRDDANSAALEIGSIAFLPECRGQFFTEAN
jgi:hypothetical protein